METGNILNLIEKYREYPYEEINLLKNTELSKKYASGSVGYLEGYFSPARFEVFCAGMRRGKLRKKPEDDNEFDGYIYYFNQENELVLSECVKNKQDVKQVILYKRLDADIIGLVYSRYLRLDYIVTYKYENGHIIEYVENQIKVEFNRDEHTGKYKLLDVGLESTSQKYCYENEVIVAVDFERKYYDFNTREETVKHRIRYPAIKTGKDEKDINRKTGRRKKLKANLKKMIVANIKAWNENDIYAISLFVNNQNDNQYKPTVTLGYNTESQVTQEIQNAADEQESRWNYAFWIQNEFFCFGEGETEEDIVYWLDENQLLNNDEEDVEITSKKTERLFVEELISIVKEIHNSKLLTEKFGKEIPIIIHGLEYYDEIAEKNIEANGTEQLMDFISFCKVKIDNL